MAARLRTIDKGYDELKASDPNMALTKCALRALIINGEIPAKKVRGKYIFSLESVYEYFAGDGVQG